MERSCGQIAEIAARTALSPSVFSFSSRARAFIAAFSSAVNPSFSAIPNDLLLDQSLQQRVDAGEAALRAFLDAVVHRRVALLGRLEAHRLRQLRLLAEVL